jgi:hypothetical protein
MCNSLSISLGSYPSIKKIDQLHYLREIDFAGQNVQANDNLMSYLTVNFDSSFLRSTIIDLN